MKEGNSFTREKRGFFQAAKKDPPNVRYPINLTKAHQLLCHNKASTDTSSYLFSPKNHGGWSQTSDISRPSLSPSLSSPGFGSFCLLSSEHKGLLKCYEGQSGNLSDPITLLSQLRNFSMRTTQTTTPTADLLVQCVQEKLFGAAVFYTEYFYRAKPTDTDCRLLLLTKYN